MICRHCGQDDEAPDHLYGCPVEDIYVGCDLVCRALKKPVTPEEVKAAYIHWRSHHYLGGCSHGE